MFHVCNLGISMIIMQVSRPKIEHTFSDLQQQLTTLIGGSLVQQTINDLSWYVVRMVRKCKKRYAESKNLALLWNSWSRLPRTLISLRWWEDDPRALSSLLLTLQLPKTNCPSPSLCYLTDFLTNNWLSALVQLSWLITPLSPHNIHLFNNGSLINTPGGTFTLSSKWRLQNSCCSCTKVS